MTITTSAAIATKAAIGGTFSLQAFLLSNSSAISAFAGLGAMLAAFFSWRTMRSQKIISMEQARIATFNGVSNLIFSQKQHFFSTMNELYSQERPWLKFKKINEKRYAGKKAEWDYIYKSERRNYINVYEYACGLYQAGALDKRLFIDVFKDDIISIYEKDFGKDVNISVRDESRETFGHLRKTYKEFCESRIDKKEC